MAKLALTDLANLQNETTATTAINNNNAATETAMENTLSLDGTSPNSMAATLDMNSNRIINLPEAVGVTEPVRFGDLVDIVAGADQLVLASQVEAETGSDNEKYVTPLRVAQRINAIIATTLEATTASSDTDLMTPVKTAAQITSKIASAGEATAGSSDTVLMTPSKTATYVTGKIASQAEAEAGSLNTVLMTPLRTAQALTGNIASQAEAAAITNNTKFMTPLRVSQTGYLSPRTAAETRTLNARLANACHVEDFGAKTDPASLTQALASGATHIRLADGLQESNVAYTIPDSVWIEGNGVGVSGITFTNVASCGFQTPYTADFTGTIGRTSGGGCRNFSAYLSSAITTTQSGTIGFNLRNVSTFTLENVAAYNFYVGYDIRGLSLYNRAYGALTPKGLYAGMRLGSGLRDFVAIGCTATIAGGGGSVVSGNQQGSGSCFRIESTDGPVNNIEIYGSRAEIGQIDNWFPDACVGYNLVGSATYSMKGISLLPVYGDCADDVSAKLFTISQYVEDVVMARGSADGFLGTSTEYDTQQTAIIKKALIRGQQLQSTASPGTAPLIVASNAKVTDLNSDYLDGQDWANPAAIGTGTPAAANFTTIGATTRGSVAGTTGNFTGQITSSLASPTAPLVVASDAVVANLNATYLGGYTWANPIGIGTGAPSTGAFTTLSATGAITSTLSTGTAPFTVASTTNVANLNASSLGGATFAAPGAIGGGTPSSGAFTTLSATGQITSTLASGTPPFVVASDAVVANLNSTYLLGFNWAGPGTIGSGTPSSGAFTTLSATGLITATGGQISFPATQNASADANVLDDYEEGDWTPVLSFGGGTTGITYGTQVGRYTKIGRMVSLSFRLTLTSKGSSTGVAVITGVPFAPNLNVPVSTYVDTMAVGPVFYMPLLAGGTTQIDLRYLLAGAATDLTDVSFNNTSQFYGTANYPI